jgi:hypothetical protein
MLHILHLHNDLCFHKHTERSLIDYELKSTSRTVDRHEAELTL